MTAAFEGFTRLIRLQGGFGVPEPPAERAGNPADFKDFWERFGWGTWIRTRTNGVRVRGSTVNLFPSRRGRSEAHNRGAGFYIGSAISQYHALTLK